MKKSELIKILTFLGSCYNNFKYPTGDDFADQAFEGAWMEMLGKYDYKTVSTAAKKVIRDNKFPPGVNNLLTAIEEMDNPSLPPGEGYRLALDAASRHGYIDPEGARESLPSVVWDTIESVGGWESFCMTEVNSYTQNTFRRVFEECSRKERDQQYLEEGEGRELIE